MEERGPYTWRKSVLLLIFWPRRKRNKGELLTLYKCLGDIYELPVGNLPHSNYLLDPYFTPWCFSKRRYSLVINDCCDRLSRYPLLAVFCELAKMSLNVVSPNYLPPRIVPKSFLL